MRHSYKRLRSNVALAAARSARSQLGRAERSSQPNQPRTKPGAARDGKCEFNLAQTTVFPSYAPVYFLHGAMHLIVGGSGRTRKLTRTDETILDQFGQPIEGDPQGRPLLISEGSYREKLRAIEDNDYLSYALFGSALAEQDMHLIKAINENPDRPVAVSMRRAGRKALLARQGELRGRLTAHELHFYDAATYPLGNPDLAYRPSASRRLVRSSA